MDDKFYVEMVESLNLTSVENPVYRWMRNTGFLPHQIAIVINAYREPHRHWHDIRHIFMMSGLLEDFSGMSPNLTESQALIIYHDLVYTTRDAFPKTAKNLTNERASATALKFHILEAPITGLSYLKETVADKLAIALLVAAGLKDENLGFDADGRAHADLLHDLDYSIFAQESTLYDRYAAGVKQEYLEAGMSEEEFNFLRIGFLRHIQETGIFKTQPFIERFGNETQGNIEREIVVLS